MKRKTVEQPKDAFNNFIFNATAGKTTVALQAITYSI